MAVCLEEASALCEVLTGIPIDLACEAAVNSPFYAVHAVLGTLMLLSG